MDISQHLHRFRKPKPDLNNLPPLEELANLIKSESTTSTQSSVLEREKRVKDIDIHSVMKFLDNQFGSKTQASYSIEDSQDLLHNLSNSIDQLYSSRKKIRQISTNKRQEFDKILSRAAENIMMVPKKQYVNVKEGQAFYLFNTVKNDISDLKDVRLYMMRKEDPSFEELFDHRIEPMVEYYDEENDIDYKRLRRSIIKSRLHKKLIEQAMASVLHELIEPESENPESGSEEEEEEVVIECKARQKRSQRNKNQTDPLREYYNIEPTAINFKNFRPVVPLNNLQVSPTEMNCIHGPIIKYGEIYKRRGKSNTFHSRWFVLRGFHLYWYRTFDSHFASGVMVVPSKAIEYRVISKQQCAELESKGSYSVTFLLDENGQAWKIILNNQIALKRYIEKCEKNFPMPEIVTYFQDLNATELKVMRKDIGSYSFNCLKDSFEAHKNLQKLILDYCNITDTDVDVLCKGLIGNTRLDTLSLCGNKLRTASIVSISDLIKQEEARWNTIMNLILNDNKFGDEGIQVLCRALLVRFECLFWPRAIHQLPIYQLELSRNDMCDAGLAGIAKLFEKSNELIKEEDDIEPRIKLDISANNFSTVSFKLFASTLAEFQGVYYLNISENLQLTESDLQSLFKTLSGNFSIIYLDITRLNITPTLLDQLVVSIQDNYILSCINITFRKELAQKLASYSYNLQALFNLQIPELAL